MYKIGDIVKIKSRNKIGFVASASLHKYSGCWIFIPQKNEKPRFLSVFFIKNSEIISVRGLLTEKINKHIEYAAQTEIEYIGLCELLRAKATELLVSLKSTYTTYLISEVQRWSSPQAFPAVPIQLGGPYVP